MNFTDTIAALATPPGAGGLAVIRVSGNDAFKIVQPHFRKNLAELPTHTIHAGSFFDPNEIIDEVVVALFKNKKSFTREDSIEISCHGSPFIARQILQALIHSGARPAEPGEFTKRAYLNGRFDLAQAEAVADLIHAETDAARRTAFSQMRGGFSKELKKLRQMLIDFAALIELELDFSEEDAEFASREKLLELVGVLQDSVGELLSSYRAGNVIKEGVSVVIAGQPNTGKSTLLNALLNEEKAIVSDIAGTTRDSVEDVITLNGLRFRFIDTAGLRHATDPIETIGVARTKEKMKQAQLILYLFDLTTADVRLIEKEKKMLEENDIPFLLIGNKIDLAPERKETEPMIFISAKNKLHIEELKAKIISLFQMPKIKHSDAIVTNLRHYQQLNQAHQALQKISVGIEQRLSADLLAAEINHALHSLAYITGEAITSDTVLESIFSRFCIGK